MPVSRLLLNDSRRDENLYYNSQALKRIKLPSVPTGTGRTKQDPSWMGAGTWRSVGTQESIPPNQEGNWETLIGPEATC